MEYDLTAINKFIHNLLDLIFNAIDNASDKLLFDTNWYQSCSEFEQVLFVEFCNLHL